MADSIKALAGWAVFALLLLVWAFAMPFVVALLAAVSVVVPVVQYVFRLQREKAARADHAKNELARLQWEKTPEGQAHLEQKRREAAEEQRRIESERDARRTKQERWRREAEERAAKAEWNLFFTSKTMLEVASMTGLEFEKFLARLLPHLGYTAIVLTPVNDQGGDILCTSKVGERVVVQAKRWKGSLGNAVVQEILGAMLHYGCDAGIIITNSTFTKAAHALASKDPRISLHDGAWLTERIKEHLPPQIPPFDWQRYKKEVLPSRYLLRSCGGANIAEIDGSPAFVDKDELLAQVAAGELPIEEAAQLFAALTPAASAPPRPKRYRGRRRRYR
ncbi:MAG TPA: restriction endonuclease [Pirellulales bacterium]|nr:restriction endonuclease [Pirellulales bacterium]